MADTRYTTLSQADLADEPKMPPRARSCETAHVGGVMSLAYTIDSIDGVVVITGDYADANAWRLLLRDVLSDPLYRRGSSFIRDLRASSNPVDVPTVMQIIAVVKEHWNMLGAHRAAIVMSSNDDAPALVAHALADFQHLPLKAFTSYEDAIKWLKGP